MGASHVYVGALALGCFYSHISTRTFTEGADCVGGQLRGDKECPFSGVTKPGRVWRKVPESDGVCTGCSISGPAAVSLLESCIRLRSVLIMMSRFMRGPVKLGIFPKV